MSLHYGGDGERRWTSKSVKMETDCGEVVLIAPCGERRRISPSDARSLALRLEDMASAAEREWVWIRSEHRTPKVAAQGEPTIC